MHEEDKVCLWLGANVMLEYPRSEAIALLEKNLADAKTALDVTLDDMGFLRDQITTTEVSTERTRSARCRAARAASRDLPPPQSLR